MTKYQQQSLFDDVCENEQFLTEQIITYLGNKRALLSFIGTALDCVKRDLHKEKLDVVDIFSGSGIVSRYMKQHASKLYTNDLEDYCNVINRCYLSNAKDIDFGLLQHYFDDVTAKLASQPLKRGFIAEMYAPKDDTNIQKGERVFYTTRNAMYLDTARQLIEQVPEPYKTYLMGPLLYEASVHNNTSGVFKGFYKNSKTGIGQYGGDGKNALQRIMADMELKLPVFSNFSCDVTIYQKDANELARELPHVDVVYMDPPYNQHPYGSNYFMLNVLNSYTKPTEVSEVSGIPKVWNKSQYNKKLTAKESMRDLCTSLDASYLLISFSSDGFISRDEMVDMLSELGQVQVLDKDYNTFRGSRNLNSRQLHIKEYLFMIKKNSCA